MPHFHTPPSQNSSTDTTPQLECLICYSSVFVEDALDSQHQQSHVHVTQQRGAMHGSNTHNRHSQPSPPTNANAEPSNAPPHLCLQCQNLICHKCLTKTLQLTASQHTSVPIPNLESLDIFREFVACPYCRVRPFVTVECGRLLERVLGSVTAKKGTTSQPNSARGGAPQNATSAPKLRDYCSHHPEVEIRYWCLTCNDACCSDCCALASGPHRSHQVNLISEIYNDKLEMIDSAATEVQERISILTKRSERITSSVDHVLRKKERHMREIKNLYERMQTLLEEKSLEKVTQLQTHEEAIKEERRLLQTMLHELNRQIQRSSNVILIQRAEEIRNALIDVNRRDETQLEDREYEALLEQTLSSREEEETAYGMLPRYASGELVVDNFKELMNQKEYIYSEALEVNGCQWRLKLYPMGTGVARGEFLSVFLELKDGVLKEPSPYEYKIELVRFNRRGHNILRQFSSVFEPNESWGYNKLVRIEDLLNEDQGLLSEEGALHVRFHVRPPSIVELVREQKAYIEHLVAGGGIVQHEEEEEPRNESTNVVPQDGSPRSETMDESTVRISPPREEQVTVLASPTHSAHLDAAEPATPPPTTHISNRVVRSESSQHASPPVEVHNASDEIAREVQDMVIELTSFTRRSRVEENDEDSHDDSLMDSSNDTLQNLHDALGGDDTTEDAQESRNDDLAQLSEEDVDDPICSPIHFQMTSREESSNEHDNEEFMLRFTKQSSGKDATTEAQENVVLSVEVSEEDVLDNDDSNSSQSTSSERSASPDALDGETARVDEDAVNKFHNIDALECSTATMESDDALPVF